MVPAGSLPGPAVAGLSLTGLSRLAPVLFALCAGACLAEPAGDPVESARSPIINGVPSEAIDDAAIGIAIFSGGRFTGFCSGVLIAENVVLTARHCVSSTDEYAQCADDGTATAGGRIYADRAAKDLSVILGPDAKSTADAIGAKVFHPKASYLCNTDIALMILDRNLKGATLAPIRLDSHPNRGDTFTAVGWGVSNNSSGLARRRREKVRISVVGPGKTPVGAIGNAEFEIGEAICSGDSGGPAFDTKTGAVIGVVSRGTNGNPASSPPFAKCVDGGGYMTHNTYTRTDGFKALILSVLQEAGAEPWLEGGVDPRKAKFGEACDTPDACRSALCTEAAGKHFCSSTCAPDAPCPTGYECRAAEGTPVCAPIAPPPAPAASKGKCSLVRAPASIESGGAFAFAAFGAVVAGVAIQRRRRGSTRRS